LARSSHRRTSVAPDVVGQALERLDLGVGHRAALQAQAAQRRRRQVGEVAVLDRAQVPLRRDVQGDGCGDLGSEPSGEIPGADAFVVEVLGELVVERHVVVRHEVADVVEQRGGDEVIRGAVGLRQCGRLERVFEFGDVLVVHAQCRRRGVQREQFVQRIIRVTAFMCGLR
jgi:hypothetical protein